jgi:formate dehydrogenase subunit delta
MTKRDYGLKLVYLANQVGKFFAHQPKAEAVASIEEHLRKFWDPRMRTQISAHLAQGGEGLEELPRLAVEQIAGQAAKENEAAAVERRTNSASLASKEESTSR